MCLIITLASTPRVYAAPVISVRVLSGALFADAGTHYELSATDNRITLEVDANMIPDGLELFFTTSAADGSNISSVFPTRSALRGRGSSHVSIDLLPNHSGADIRSELLLIFEYANSSEPPPRTERIQITQRSTEAPWQPNQPPEPDTLRDELAIIAMLESSVTMPDILFVDRTAILSYSSGGVIAWAGTGADVQLTIRDVSALSADTPLVIDDFRPTVNAVLSPNRYTVTIPPAQVNYILGSFADEIVNGFPHEITLMEDPLRSDDRYSFLIPTATAELPRGATVFTDSPFVTVPNDSVLALAAETEWLASFAGRDADIRFLLRYNGIPASNILQMTIALSRPELYPGVMRTLTDTDFPGVNEPEPVRPEQGEVGRRLTQTYDASRSLFVQRLNSGHSFTSNIPNGLVTNGPVVLEFSENIEFTILRDDKPTDYYRARTSVTEPGSYRVLVRVVETVAQETDIIPSEITLEDIVNMQDITLAELLDTTQDTVVHEGEFRFRIVAGMTNSLVFYNPPPGYRITELIYEDIPVTNFSPRFIRLTADGTYRVTVAGAEGEPVFTTEIMRFTMLPVIFLEGVADGASTTRPVTFRVESRGPGIADVDVRLDNARVPPRGGHLTAPGLYRITATDYAGNSSTVSFRILYSVNVSGWTVIALTILILGGLTGTMVYFRRNMRVR